MWADITEEEREGMRVRREEEPELTEKELSEPLRYMFDLDDELVTPRY